jgi:uncharacterized protein (TIGR00725 family)
VFDREAAEVAARLPAGPRLAVIGSTSFWHAESAETCAILGRSLAALDGLVLVTGGVEGVGEAVARSFWAARGGLEGGPRVFHILPRGHARRDHGETLFTGADMAERREVLGRLAVVYVVIEGGPGTVHEASVAIARSAVVIPVGRSGGHAAVLHREVPRPSCAPEPTWSVLARADASPAEVAGAVTDIVRAHLAASALASDRAAGRSA